MKCEEALKAMREGKKVRRHFWSEAVYIEYEVGMGSQFVLPELAEDNITFCNTTKTALTTRDILADDWEIYEEISEPDIIIKAKGFFLPTADIKSITINGNEITDVKHIIPRSDDKTIGLYFDCNRINVEWESPDTDLSSLDHLSLLREFEKYCNPNKRGD